MTLASIEQEDPKAAYVIGRTLPLEGGFVDDPADPGGETNRGVSLRWALAEIEAHPETVRMFDIDHDGHVDRKDIVGLTQDEAADIYYTSWWRPGWYAGLVPALIAWKCFDIAVNTGPKRAALILQKALAGCGHPVAIDAVIGPATVLAVKDENANDGGAHLLHLLRLGQADFYSRLVVKQPKLRRFLDGWLARARA